MNNDEIVNTLAKNMAINEANSQIAIAKMTEVIKKLQSENAELKIKISVLDKKGDKNNESTKRNSRNKQK